MDSLTQVVLGAAVGEAALGRKIGNRAMLWGALAGFLPDLDVTSNLVMDEISALAVHRGITHSLFFAVLFPFLLAWVVHRLYQSGLYQRKAYRIVSSLVVLIALGTTANFLPYMVTETWNMKLLGGTFAVIALIVLLLNRTYYKRPLSNVDATYMQWYNLFFWGIITHPLLDSFTTYGTQLFLPFSDHRVSFNVISVVDPIYTIPFLICVIIASVLKRGTMKRSVVNWIGIGLSSLYMIFCVYHKFQFNQIFEEALAKEEVNYTRYMSTPMILNNVLWAGLAETDSTYVQGFYSFLQDERKAHIVNHFPKNHYLMDPYNSEKDYKTLKWFSDGYYNVIPRPDLGDDPVPLQYNDLRFGIMASKYQNPDDFVFKFMVIEKEDGLEIFQPGDRDFDFEDSFKDLWSRIMGNTDYAEDDGTGKD